MTRIRKLAFGVLILAIASATVRILHFIGTSLSKPLADWRSVTIEGFHSGVTLGELEHHLGPPKRDKDYGTSRMGITKSDRAEWVEWAQSGNRMLVCFRQHDSLAHLLGKRIFLGERVIAHAETTPFRMDGTLEKSFKRLLGPGKSLKFFHRLVPDYPMMDITYQDLSLEDQRGHRLVVHLEPIPTKEEYWTTWPIK